MGQDKGQHHRGSQDPWCSVDDTLMFSLLLQLMPTLSVANARGQCRSSCCCGSAPRCSQVPTQHQPVSLSKSSRVCGNSRLTWPKTRLALLIRDSNSCYVAAAQEPGLLVCATGNDRGRPHLRPCLAHPHKAPLGGKTVNMDLSPQAPAPATTSEIPHCRMGCGNLHPAAHA